MIIRNNKQPFKLKHANSGECKWTKKKWDEVYSITPIYHAERDLMVRHNYVVGTSTRPSAKSVL